jgi:hypothetical protein
MNDNQVEIRIVGNAADVAPAVEVAKGEIAGLGPVMAQLTAQMVEMTAVMRSGFTAGAASTEKMAVEMKHLEVETEKEALSLKSLAMSAKEGAEAIEGMKATMMGFAEVMMAAFAIEYLAEFAEKIAEVAEKTRHTAEQFGMTVPAVQQLQGVALQTGISVDALTRSFGIMDKNLVTSKGTTSAAANAFKAMGVSIDDGKSQMEKFGTIADKFAAMEDGPKKAALAMLLFGKSGKELIPILNLGSEGLARLNEKTAEYGGVSQDANDKGMALAESINEFKLAMDGVTNVLTSAFAPILKEIVDSMNAVILAFVESYREGGIVAVIFADIAGIVGVVGEVINVLIGIIKALWDGASEIFSAIGAIFTDAFGVKIPNGAMTAKTYFNVIRDALVVLKDIFIIAIDIIVGMIVMVIDNIRRFAAIAKDAFTLNWGSIDADWKAGTDRIAADAEAAAKRVKVAMAEAAGAIMAASHGEGPPQGKTGVPEVKAARTGDGGELGATHKAPKAKGEKDDLVQQLDAVLTAKKLAWAMEQDAQGTAHAFSVQEEADYWAKILQRTNLSAKDRAAVETKYLAAHSQILKEKWGIEEAGYKESLDAAGKDADAKLELVTKHTQRVGEMFGLESREYADALREQLKAKLAAQAQLDEIDAVHQQRKREHDQEEIDEAQRIAQFRVQMGVDTDAQLLNEERKFAAARYAIAAAALQREMELAQQYGASPAEQAKIHARMMAEQQAYQNRLTEIDRKAVLARSTMERTAISATASLWATNIAKLVTLQQGFGATLKGLYTGMVSIVSNALASILEKWLVKHISTLLLGRAASTTAAVAQVTSAIGLAGANGVASFAAAPWPIDMGAPAFGASMAAAAAAFAPAASAAGGWWDVGQDTTTRIHAKEMVLPAWAAQPLRNMLAGGGSANSNAPPAANDAGGFHYHDHTESGVSEDAIMAKRAVFAKAMKMAHREGMFKGAGLS